MRVRISTTIGDGISTTIGDGLAEAPPVEYEIDDEEELLALLPEELEVLWSGQVGASVTIEVVA